MTDPEPETKINVEGDEGGSLFWRPLKPAISQENISEIQKKLDVCIKRYEGTTDDRALAIMGALIVENELDNFLANSIRGYNRIASNKDLTFSFKINLAISLKIMPTRILNSILPIRKIRNIFAHHLEVTTFEEAKELDANSDQPSFPMLYGKIKTFQNWDNDDDRETFKELIFMIMLGISVYSKHVAMVQEYIWKRENLDKILNPQTS